MGGKEDPEWTHLVGDGGGCGRSLLGDLSEAVLLPDGIHDLGQGGHTFLGGSRPSRNGDVYGIGICRGRGCCQSDRQKGERDEEKGKGKHERRRTRSVCL